MRNFAIIAVIVIVGAAIKFGSFADAREETRDQLLELCANEAPCESVVIEHFDTCFAENSTGPARRSSGSIDGKGLVQCLNRKGRVPYFDWSEE